MGGSSLCHSSVSRELIPPCHSHAIQEDAPQQPEEKAAAASRVEKKGSAKSKASKNDSDDEGSVCGQPTSANAKRTRACAICDVKTSVKWFYCPEGLMDHEEKEKKVENKRQSLVMCEDCGIRWRHCELASPALSSSKLTADLSLLARSQTASSTLQTQSRDPYSRLLLRKPPPKQRPRHWFVSSSSSTPR